MSDDETGERRDAEENVEGSADSVTWLGGRSFKDSTGRDNRFSSAKAAAERELEDQRHRHDRERRQDEHDREQDREDRAAARHREEWLFRFVLVISAASLLTGFTFALLPEDDGTREFGRSIALLILGALGGALGGYVTGRSKK